MTDSNASYTPLGMDMEYEDEAAFRNINRPIAGPTTTRSCRLGSIRFSSSLGAPNRS